MIILLILYAIATLIVTGYVAYALLPEDQSWFWYIGSILITFLFWLPIGIVYLSLLIFFALKEGKH